MAEQGPGDQQWPRSSTGGYEVGGGSAPNHKVWGEVESTSTSISQSSNGDSVGQETRKERSRKKIENLPLKALKSASSASAGLDGGRRKQLEAASKMLEVSMAANTAKNEYQCRQQERLEKIRTQRGIDIGEIHFSASEGSSSVCHESEESQVSQPRKLKDRDTDDDIPEERLGAIPPPPGKWEVASGTHNVDPADDPQNVSVGSVEHYEGTCRPCAWFWQGGCWSGQDCQYCHLCGEGVCKQRRKERHWRANQERRLARVAKAKDAATSSGCDRLQL